MQVQLDDIAGSECLLRQIREEELIDDASTRHPDGALLFACRMGCHHHAAVYSFGSYWDLGAIVKAAHHLTFGTLLELIGGQVQPRLDEGMIKDAVLLAASQEGESSQI